MSESGTNGDAWLVVPTPVPAARIALYCFPYAGSGAAVYRSWPAELPPWVEVRAVQPPGRENRLGEPAFTRLNTLVSELERAIDGKLAGDFAFFGHSVGALVAYELTRSLQRRGRRLPLVLAVGGHRAPHLPDPDPPVHSLDADAFVEALRRLEGTPKELLCDRELLAVFEPTIRADFAVAETYRHTPREPLPCPIVAYAATGDTGTPVDDVVAWGEHTAAGFRSHVIEAGHFFVQTHSAIVCRTLADELVRLLATPA